MKDPYVYDGTNVLINLANITNQEKLDSFETTLSRIASVELINHPVTITNTNDIFLIHNALFHQVYSWAGQPRTINIYKEEYVLAGLSVEYSNYKNIKKDLENIQKEIEKIDWAKCSKSDFISRIVKIISSIWRVHPFREGNTRAVCMFLFLFMKQFNYKLNVDFISQNSKYFRNALVLASIGEYSEYEHLEKLLKDSVNIRIIENNTVKYQTIKGYELEKYKYNYHTIKK